MPVKTSMAYGRSSDRVLVHVLAFTHIICTFRIILYLILNVVFKVAHFKFSLMTGATAVCMENSDGSIDVSMQF